MAVQMVSPASDLLMLLSAAAVVVLAAATAAHLARRRWRSAGTLAAAMAALIAAYAAALLAVGLSSRAEQLRPGDAKCFDDWCAAMLSARPDPPARTVLVDVQLQNRGRGRAMRSEGARAYLELPGGGEVAPEDGSGLRMLLQPGQRVDLELTFPAPAALRGVRFVVDEGGGGVGPGTFEIGGEGSPFHPRAGWPL
ncbi:MAG TPA: hypothetical protein VKF59_12585 [Candidatus Dormibacteraeota bacterium]|nr:hypothetical protein [Candidatus Dormibacteraeota bacterium]